MIKELHVTDVKKALDHISATMPRGYWVPTPTMVNAWYVVIQNDMRRKSRTAADFVAAIERWCATQKEPPGSPVALNEVMDAMAAEKREREQDKLRVATPRQHSSISSATARVMLDYWDGKIPKERMQSESSITALIRERMDD